PRGAEAGSDSPESSGAKQRQHGYGNERGEPSGEPGARILLWNQAQRQRYQDGQNRAFRQTVKHAVERQRRDRIPTGRQGCHHHCSPPFPWFSSSRRRFNSAASILLSSSRLSTSSS